MELSICAVAPALIAILGLPEIVAVCCWGLPSLSPFLTQSGYWIQNKQPIHTSSFLFLSHGKEDVSSIYDAEIFMGIKDKTASYCMANYQDSFPVCSLFFLICHCLDLFLSTSVPLQGLSATILCVYQISLRPNRPPNYTL